MPSCAFPNLALDATARGAENQETRIEEVRGLTSGQFAGGSPMKHDEGCLAPAVAEESRLTIDDRPYRLVCVDDVLPRHSVARIGARPRLIYAEGEVAHFQLGRRRFALVPEAECERPHAATGEPGAAPADIHELLTNRELQIVQLICMGCLTKQVADRLHLSEFTVRSYLKTVYCKLGVRSRGAMVYRYAQAFQRRGGGLA